MSNFANPLIMKSFTRPIISFFSLALILSISLTQFEPALAASDQAFTNLWNSTDLPVAAGQLHASWLWGPTALATFKESYQDAPTGQRLVQYYDKGRFEINNPAGDRTSQWFVTSGRLCSELVSGRLQTGDNSYEIRQSAPIPVAGDLASPVGPTYATFNQLNRYQPYAPRSGFVDETIDRNGGLGHSQTHSQRVRYAGYDATLGHNMPDIFINWLNNLNTRGVSGRFLVGLPISEPYWATFMVNGAPQEVLVQLFERRALTFNPANEAAWQVEMGNIGLHYVTWRYNNNLPTQPPASAGPTLDSEEMVVLDLMNQYRQAHGLAPLSLNPVLNTTARWMAQDMADKQYISHTDSTGRDSFKRLADFGYPSDTFRGENLGAGFEKGAAVMKGWEDSVAHNANLLNPNYRMIGISRVYNPNSPYKWYWSTEFGSR